MDIFSAAALIEPIDERRTTRRIQVIEPGTREHQQGTVVLASERQHLCVGQGDQPQHHAVKVSELVEPVNGRVVARVGKRNRGVVAVGIGQHTCHVENIRIGEVQRTEASGGEQRALLHFQGCLFTPEGQNHLGKPSEPRRIGQHRQTNGINGVRAGVQPEKTVFETAPDLIVRENDPRSSIAPVFAWHRGILRFRPGFNGLFNKTGEGEFAAVHGGR